MTIPPLVSIRTPFLLFIIILCSLLALAIACGGSADLTPTQPPTATAASYEAPEPTDSPSEPEPTAPPTTSDASSRDWNVLGSPDALVTVLDYSDFQ